MWVGDAVVEPPETRQEHGMSTGLRIQCASLAVLPVVLALACERKLPTEDDGNGGVTGAVVPTDTGRPDPGTTDADDDGWPVGEDCDDADPSVKGPTEWFADDDGDGHAGDARSVDACLAPLDHYAEPTDCDDTNAAVHPDAPEVCNGLDDDCDSWVDLDDDSLDAATLEDRYPDVDADGYGDPAGRADGCATDPGTVGNGDDCDDTDATVSPETLWYADTDGDGYGDPTAAVAQCEAPALHTRDDHDCNDRDPAVHPGVDEVCNGEDDDCDTLVDDDDPSLDLDTTTPFYPDLDTDGYGDATAAVSMCVSPSDHVATAGDCDDTDDRLHPGQLDVCGDGLDNDCDGAVPVLCGGGQLDASALTAQWTGLVSGDSTGQSVAFVGDVDGDGLGDVLVGATDHDTPGVSAGAAFLVPGSGVATGGSLSAQPGWLGEAMGDSLGEKVAGPGDVDGDGYDDLLLGAPDADGTDTNAGRAYLVYGGTSWSGSGPISAADHWWDGLDDIDRLGDGLAPAGDHDGDGLADLLLGAPGSDVGAANAGSVYVVHGSTSAHHGGATLHNVVAIHGAESGEALGHWFGLGHTDLDGDGLHDLALGAYSADGTVADVGAVYVFRGGSRRTSSATVADADLTLAGTDYDGANSYFGYAVSDSGGDIDGDGHDDLVVGAYAWDEGATNAGGLFVFYGSTSALAVDRTADDADARLVGASAYDYCGKEVAVLPDLNGDGADDLVLGCYGEDTAGYTAGAAHVVLGGSLTGAHTMPTDATFSVVGDSPGDSLGHSVAGGDVDGDGLGDLLLGASDAGASGEGSLYVLMGQAGIGLGP